MAPSVPHALLVHLLTSAPALMRALAVRAGARLPDGPCVLSPSEFTTLTPVERRADAVVVVGEGQDRQVVVGEVQTGIDAEKVWTWPEYVVFARSHHRCPARLVVFALTDEVARWARRVTSDAGMTVHAIVLGPEDFPVPTPQDCDDWLAERLLLAAVVHGESDRGPELARLAPRALLAVDGEQRSKYLDVLFVLLKNVAHDLLRELMLDSYEFQDPWLKGEFQKATAVGEVKSLRLVLRELLAERGVEPIDAVVDAADVSLLRTWLVQLFHGEVAEVLVRRG